MNTEIGKQRVVGWVLGKYCARDLRYVLLDGHDAEVIRHDSVVSELNNQLEAQAAYSSMQFDRVAELTAEVIQVRAEFAEGQGEYEQLDRLMRANERNMHKRIDELQDELAQYKDKAERGDWIIRNASWMRYEYFTAMYVELPMDVHLHSYALRQDAIDIARNALKEGL